MPAGDDNRIHNAEVLYKIFGWIAAISFGIATGLKHRSSTVGFLFVGGIGATAALCFWYRMAILKHKAAKNKAVMPIGLSLPDKAEVTPVSRPITQQTPAQILKEIDEARPTQREALRKTFVGARVHWLLPLFNIHTDRSGRVAVHFADPTTMWAGVMFFVSESDMDQLRLCDENALVYVSGSIESVSTGNVWLKDGKVELPSP